MKKNLRNKLVTGLAIATLGAGVGGCADIMYTHPVDKFLWDNVIPSGLAPHSIREKQAKEHAEDNYQKESCSFGRINGNLGLYDKEGIPREKPEGMSNREFVNLYCK